MLNRACRLLVLSPRARSGVHVREYKPFGKRRLSELIDEAATKATRWRMRPFDRHEVFGGFFFGSEIPDEHLQAELRTHVPTSLVDCGIYRSSESAAVAAAAKALLEFAIDAGIGGKLIVLICNDHCSRRLDFDSALAQSDEELLGHLWSDLCGNLFKKLGRAIGER